MTEQAHNRPAWSARNFKILSGALFGSAALTSLALAGSPEQPPEPGQSISPASLSESFNQQAAGTDPAAPPPLTESPELPHERIPAASEEEEEANAQEILDLLAEEGKASPSPEIQDGIAYASTYTGVDEIYLYRLAHAESTFRESAHNGSGGGKGACGLYQFRVASTYLEAIYKHGDKFPEEYRHLAATVEQVQNRHNRTVSYKIKDGVDKQAVYDACYDPRFSSMLAAFFTIDLKDAIKNKVAMDRPITHADLYITHFLGINGGPRLLKAYEKDSERDRHVSNYIGKSQRRANAGIFNNVKTVEDFYDFFVEEKGMTDSPFDLGEPQFQLHAKFNLPETAPIPLPRPQREEKTIKPSRLNGPA